MKRKRGRKNIKRCHIRNIGSPRENKPRVFDFLIDDDGKAYFEVKLKKNCERILLSDVFSQIPQEMMIEMNYRA